ncbi:MAG: protein translocase subunit SecD, partial [Bryobacteraceae bacterium]
MQQNLRIKALIILGVVLVCVYGIIGLPKSGAELVQNFEKNIRLGLDLKGGTQLVLQIQLQDAFKAEADSAIDRIKDALTKAGVEFGSIDRNDPSNIDEASSIQINVRGVPAVKAGSFRNLIADQFGSVWVMAPVNSTDYKLTMKASEALRLDQDTMAQSQTTIGKKIDALGLAEATVQERGGQGTEAELMVQLPGVDDPARVKGIIQTAAILEWYP